MSPEGLEPTPENPRKTPESVPAGTKSGTLSDDPGLVEVVEGWGDLPEAIRSAVLALVRASRTG